MYNFLERYRVDDFFLEAAYSGLPAQTKGWIKKTIALAQSIHCNAHSAAAYFERKCSVLEREGLSLRICSFPAEQCLMLFPADYPAAVRAAAAAAQALFTGVDEIYAVGVIPAVQGKVKKFRYASEFAHNAEGSRDDFPLNFNLLGALELVGVENVYCLHEQDLDEALEMSVKNSGSVRARF